MRESDIQDTFGKFGRMTRCDLKKGYAFVTYETQDIADDAKDALDGKNFFGSQIVIEPAKPRNSGIHFPSFRLPKKKKKMVQLKTTSSSSLPELNSELKNIIEMVYSWNILTFQLCFFGHVFKKFLHPLYIYISFYQTNIRNVQNRFIVLCLTR